MPAPGGRRGGRAARRRCGTDDATRGARGSARPARLARAELELLRRRRERLRRAGRRLSGPARPPCGAGARRAGAPVVFNPLVSLCGHARRPTAAASRRARCRPARCGRSTAPPFAPPTRRRGHRARTPTSSPSSPGSEHVEVVLRRRGGAGLQPGWRAGEPSRRALRRQADPAARARDDPRGGAARTRARVPRSSAAASSRRCSQRRPAERRVGALGRVRAAADELRSRRRARSGSSARRRRRRA